MSPWNEDNIREKAFGVLVSNSAAANLTIKEARVLASHIAQSIWLEFEHCQRIAENAQTRETQD